MLLFLPMKAIVSTAPGRVDWQDLLTPEPGPHEVRIRCMACGICATDLEMLAGWGRTCFPAIPGHEWAGIVDAVGSGVTGLPVGTPCVGENVLSDGGEVGFEHPGGYGEYLITEASRIHRLPEDYPFAAATLIEPLAVCVRALRRLRLVAPRTLLILGDGPIGLLMVALARHAGVAHVTLVGGRNARLETARTLGAAQTLNYHDFARDRPDAFATVLGRRFPAIVECSGSAPAARAALSLADQGGKILIVGDYGAAQADFRWNDILHRELELIGSNASAEAWPEAVSLAVPLRAQLESMVTAVYPARQYPEAIEAVRTRRDTIKIVLSW